MIGGLTVAGLAADLVYRASGDRDDPPWQERSEAQAALRSARAADADRWAPRVMANAERAAVVALAEMRTQELRSLLTRDYRGARTALEEARWAALLARRSADHAREWAHGSAESAIREARRALGMAEEFARAMPLPAAKRSQLQTARLALREAESRNDEGDFRGAVARAEVVAAHAAGVVDFALGRASRYSDPARLATWRRWVADTVSWSRRQRAAAIVVVKESHRLVLYRAGVPVSTLTAELGWNTAHDKARQGDAATPEGRYRITEKKQGSRTRFYKALLLDYPNAEDRRRFDEARRAGIVPAGATPGGWIEIHGNGGRGADWTDGCIALTDREMDRIFAAVKVGTPVTIVGSLGEDGGEFTELLRRHGDGVAPP